MPSGFASINSLRRELDRVRKEKLALIAAGAGSGQIANAQKNADRLARVLRQRLRMTAIAMEKRA